MNAQEIYNTVKAGLASQGWIPSVDAYGWCAFRDNLGRKCAAGWLIPDEVYDDHMEGEPIEQLFELYSELEHLSRHVELIQKLQDAHDSFVRDVWHKPSRKESLQVWVERVAVECGLHP